MHYLIDCECSGQNRLNDILSTDLINRGISTDIKRSGDKLKFSIDVMAPSRENSMIERVDDYGPWSYFVKRLVYIASKEYSPPSDADERSYVTNP